MLYEHSHLGTAPCACGTCHIEMPEAYILNVAAWKSHNKKVNKLELQHTARAACPTGR